MRWLVLAAAVALAGCPQAPPVAPTPACDEAHPCPPTEDPAYVETEDDGIGTIEGNACRALRNLRCPEGDRDMRTNRTCFQRQVAASRYAPAPYECILAATSQPDVRACGTKDERRFRCLDD